MIRPQKIRPTRPILERAPTAKQSLVYALRGRKFAACPSNTGEFGSRVTFDNQSFANSIKILRTGTYNDVLFSAGYSDTTVDYSIGVYGHKVRLRLNSRAEGIIDHLHDHVLVTPATDWVQVEYGYDETTQKAFIIVDGDRQDFDHPDFYAQRQQRFFIGGSNANNAGDSTEFYDIQLVLNDGALQISYLCDSDAGNVCANSNASSGTDFNGITYDEGAPGPGLAQAPSVATPEPPPPEIGEKYYTAYASDPDATFQWWYKANNDASNTWQPALTSINCTQSGDHGEILTVNDADFNDAGQVAPMAFTDAFPSGKLADEPAKLIVIDGDTDPKPIDQTAPVLLYSDAKGGKKSGYSDADPDLGVPVTVWGHRLGSGLGADTFIEIGNRDGTAWVKLDQARHYPAAEPWGQYGKPIPWLQSVCFHLTDQMPDEDYSQIRITVAGKQCAKTLPIAVHSDGRIIHMDYDAGDNTAPGTLENPIQTYAEYFRKSGAGDTFIIHGTTTRESHMMKTQSDSGGRFFRIEKSTSGFPLPTNIRPMNFLARPGSTPHFRFHGEHNVENKLLAKGISLKMPHTSISKLKVSTDLFAIETLSDGAVGGYSRVVGNDVEGCWRKESGTGILTAGDNNPKAYTESPDNANDGVRILGNNVHGSKTMNRFDHAIYLAGHCMVEGGEVAYNWCHDNNFGGGSTIVVNHQEPRVKPYGSIQSHFIHHNLVDCRQPEGSWPPDHDPKFHEVMNKKGEYGPDYPSDQDYHDEPHSVAIGFSSDGYHITRAPLVEFGQPMYAYCNICIGANEPRRDKPRVNGDPGMLTTAWAGGGVLFNNLFIDFVQYMQLDYQFPNGDRGEGNHNGAMFEFINNAYVFTDEPVAGAGNIEYISTRSAREETSSNNLFWAAGPVDETQAFGKDAVRTEDPAYILSSIPGEKAIILGNASLASSGVDVIPINVEYDFNGALYDGTKIAIGPVQYDEES